MQPNVGYYGGVSQVVNGTSESVVREEPVTPVPTPVHESLAQPPISISAINDAIINQQPPIMVKYSKYFLLFCCTVLVPLYKYLVFVSLATGSGTTTSSESNSVVPA